MSCAKQRAVTLTLFSLLAFVAVCVAVVVFCRCCLLLVVVFCCCFLVCCCCPLLSFVVVFVLFQACDSNESLECGPLTSDRAWAWKVHRPMSTARKLHGLVAHGGRLFAFGGMTVGGGHRPVQSAESYDPEADSWSPIRNLPVGACVYVGRCPLSVKARCICMHSNAFAQTLYTQCNSLTRFLLCVFCFQFCSDCERENMAVSARASRQAWCSRLRPGTGSACLLACFCKNRLTSTTASATLIQSALAPAATTS